VRYWEKMNLSNFSGPMDLLYNMVKEKQMNIMELNVVELTNEYMAYIKSQQSLDIEVASEYLTMAATLLELKSKSLLPVDETTVIEDDQYSYDIFLEQLSRYDQIRKVSNFLSWKQREYFETFSPKKSKQKFKISPLQEPNIALDLNLDQFAQAFKHVLEKQQAFLFTGNLELEDDQVQLLETKILSPQEIMSMVLEKMKQRKISEWKIEDLLDFTIFNLKNFISIFLAILDLVKYQIIELNQPKEEELYVRFTQYALENPGAVNGLEFETYEQ